MRLPALRPSHYLTTALTTGALLGACLPEAHAQVEVAPWGNLTGIRQEGQLLEINSSLQLMPQDWAHARVTGRERQRPHYTRDGTKQLITTRLDSLNLTETVADAGSGKATVTVSAAARSDMEVLGLFFALALPPQSTVELLDAQGKVVSQRTANTAPVQASRLRIIAPTHRIEASFADIRWDYKLKAGDGAQVNDTLREVARHGVGTAAHILQVAVARHIVSAQDVENL